MSLKIKDLEIDGLTFLAPLAGITNLPFRRLVKKCGCAVVCSEMVSAKGIFYNSDKTIALMRSDREESPLSIQLFGSDPDAMARGASFVEDLNVADIIDINFGCSVKKVVKQGAGVALMKEPSLARNILKAFRKATHLPFTIKIRSGWDASGEQALQIARIAEQEGVDAIVLHPRTAVQGFRGKSDWRLIKKLKSAISIPVIGNGDINSVEDADRMITDTNCDGVMIGRAAMRNPFLPAQVDHFLKTGAHTCPTSDMIFDAMADLTQSYMDYFGEGPACKMLRGRLTWFVKGYPQCSNFRKQLSQIRTRDEALELIDTFRSTLK
jgi:tRNA-dihydrouridine synthase B